MSFAVKQLEAAKQLGWQVELFGSLHAHRVGIRSVQGPHMRIESGLRACLKNPLIDHSAAKDRFRTR